MTLENTQEVEEMVNHKMDLTIENLKQDLSGIHAGRVSPSMLESVKVDYYGNATPINQVANISTPE
ncbi:MAG: ribosome recycling factor, partial [SAR324 cluster bacterium]|nr:ribosome recycling factor [SAR324 cluster bacterium]